MNQIDDLIRTLGADTPAADRAEQNAVEAARRMLRAALAAEDRRFPVGRRRRRALMLFAALALTGIAVPAFGVAKGWFGAGAVFEGVRGSAPPQLTSQPVVVLSGEPEESWAIEIARSNQGLCLNVDGGDDQFDNENYRLGDCGYADVRGHLPPDVRGDPSAPCIGTTALVPCGSRREYWVAIRGSVFVPDAERAIVVGAAAAEVASVELILANGKAVHAEVVERPLGADVPLSIYWAELGREQGLEVTPRSRSAEGEPMACNAGELVEEVVARDSKGKLLGRRVPRWNANPAGDPNGPHRPPGLATEPCV
jgi:hypothetical protein